MRVELLVGCELYPEELARLESFCSPYESWPAVLEVRRATLESRITSFNLWFPEVLAFSWTISPNLITAIGAYGCPKDGDELSSRWKSGSETKLCFTCQGKISMEELSDEPFLLTVPFNTSSPQLFRGFEAHMAAFYELWGAQPLEAQLAAVVARDARVWTSENF